MKNFKLNLKGLYGYRQSLLSRSPQPRDNREMSERRPSEERTLLAPLPQRFARYAAILIMLLTLGVGQMWALDIYLDITAANWPADGATIRLWPGTGSDITGTSVATNLYKFTVSSATGTMYFKRMNGSTTWNEASVSYNSSYNLYKLTGWNAAACSNANVSTATKTHYIYFDNSTTSWSNSYKYFVIGHDNPTAYSKVYSMSALSHTKLWYVAQSSDSWTDLTYYAICSPTSSWSGTSWGSSNISNANKYAAPYKDKYDMNNGSSYLLTPASSSNNCALTIDYKNSYSTLNYSQTVKKYTSTDGGSTYSAASINSGTVTITPYKLTNNGTVSNSSNTGTLDEASETSVSKDAVYTGEVTVTASANTGYTFVGWFTAASGGSAVSTDASYTYNAPKSTKTIYARFKETRYEVKVATITPSAGGSATPTSWTYMGQISGGNITATPNTGYSFSGWSILSGGGGYFGESGTATTSSTANTKFRPTKSSSLKATFTANSYTFTLNGNEGSDGSVTIKYDSDAPTSISHSNRAGYSLNGYYTAASGGSEVINADGSLNNVSGWVSGGYWKQTDETQVLYAQWTKNIVNYAVTYDVHSSGHGTLAAANSSTSAAISSGDEVVYGTGVTFTASPSTGYTVDGWFSNEACTSPIAGAGTGNTYSTAISAATSVYVKFQPITYTITYNLNSGANPGGAPTSYTIESSDVTLPTPTRSGYSFAGWYANSDLSTGGVHTKIAAGSTGDKEYWAKWTENMTTVTISASPVGTGTFTINSVAGSSASVGVTTTKSIVAVPHADYTWTSWSATNCSVSPTNNKSTTLSGDGSSSTGMLTATFTLVPCSLMYGSSTPLNSPTSTAMSYDLETGAYYKDVTTNSSPYFFRFSHNDGKQYSGDWNSYPDVNVVSGDGTKVNCNTEVQGWENKASLKYTGANGSSIRIWFDYQNKKAWITETTYSVTVEAGAGGSVSPTSVSGVGASIVSGDITATPSTGYVFTDWTLPSGISAAAGYSATSNPIHINATAASKTITANFAAATAFIEGRFHITNASRDGNWTNTFSSGNWDENSTRIKFTWDGTNNRYELHTYAKPKELSTQISGYNPYFYVKESSSSSSLANVSSYWSATSQTLTAAGTGNKKSLVSSGTFHNDYLRFNSTDESGYTVLYFDETGVWYELEQTLKYDANGGTGSAPATVYYLKGTNATAAAANTFTREGYTFNGWKTAASSGTSYAAGANVPMNSNITLYAQWTPKQTTVSFNANTSAEGYGSGSAPSSVTANFGVAMPSISIGVTAQNGYGCIGYFDDPVNGTQYYDGTGASVKNWDKTDATATLYAHYKKAEITAQTFSPSTIVEEGTDLTVTVTVDPTPTGSTYICWRLLQNNGNPVASQPEFTWDNSNKELTFTAPATGGTYKLEATLRLGGSDCSGTVLDKDTANFVVANDHTVTVLYKCGDVTIKSSTEAPAKPTDWTSITAPDIIGYSFSKWKAGDGVTIEGADANGEKASATINYKAIYDGSLTAIYTKKRMIYFYNTLGWGSVYVYFYKNDSYWENDRGSGSKTTSTWTDTPYSEGKHGQMLPVSEGSNIYYFDAEAAGVNASYDDVVFTEHSQHNYEFFYNTNAARRGDYKSSMPMFVPLAGQTAEVHNKTNYYNHGYWMNYPENTGYTLKIYNDAYATKETGAVREFLFPYSEDKKMPLKMDVEFNDNGTHQYWFMVYRNDGAYIGNTYTFNQNYNSEQVITEGNNKSKLVTSAPGNYKFTLTYHDNGSGTVNYYIDVDFPIAKNDYRIVYNDNAKWSQSTAHSASWYHPSDVINKIAGDATEDKKDIVSFYVAHGSTISMKFQYASNITDAGVVTWTDVTGGTIDLSAFSSVITKPGVYNFHVTQAVGGGISVEKVEPYTGNYYIRTDCAGNTKWDSYKSLDHQMTYTEFSSRRSTNTFGELFTHYYTHWCERGSNIKFVIANDYSPCISDTLAQDIPDTYSNTDAGGTLKTTDGVPLPVNDKYSANVRFMYNDSTNKISRAYVASSTDLSRLFLVLRGNDEVRGDDDEPISDQGITNGVIMDDTQNWIYERTLRILPGTRFKLFACYAKTTPSQSEAQYFRGAYDSGNFTTDANSVVLVAGDPEAGYQNVRVVYDFKTNRLVCAWLPDNSAINGTLPIHADVMIIREHQEAAKQITFANAESKLSDVLTVYGTMKFNRWVLNNKSSAAGHAVLPSSDQKSIYERALYFISFPFDVNLSEVFGFGTYGKHWIIENYDGLNRAKNGYWRDSPSNWKYVTNPNGYVLEANKGYILCLDLDEMKDNNEEFWANNIETVELYFPSTTTYGAIQRTNVTIDALGDEYQCTINRGDGTEGDRRIKDSYWRCLGVPSFANYNSTLSDGSSTITWQTGNSLPYLYEWNMTDNSLTAQGTSTYNFKAMHAYLTQCATDIVWTATSYNPSSVAARRSDNEVLSDREFRLELAENGEKKDQTYVRLSMDETVTAGFEFGNDLSKELNAGKSNLYTWIASERAAANSLPLSTEQTTVVRVGVVANANGDYTISLPDGTDGVGVTLIDNETGVRTSLSALDYTVTLEKGTYDDRFVLEISPIQQTPTGVDEVQSDEEQGTKVRKVLIDQKMYILRDGKMYDARGALITL